MVEILEPLYIPAAGAYTTGDHVELGETLEKQLIDSGKARESQRTAAKIGGVEQEAHHD